MLIIFIAHVHGNPWKLYIPARFGWSDATEMFVFCSGYAAAIAFGGTFIRAGFWMGTARILYRCWQIYAAHIGMFFFITAIAVIGTRVLEGTNYISRLNLNRFFSLTADAMVGMFTLSYVPNYFDILPMYIVALALIPVLMAMAKLSPGLAMATSIGIYAASWIAKIDFSQFSMAEFYIIEWQRRSPINLPAEPWSDRPWFFNPFCWQFIFFTGFALSRGWVKVPRPRLDLGLLALAIVMFAMVTSYRPIWSEFSELDPIREAIRPYRSKTDFGILRWIHFVSAAYLMHCIFASRQWLLTTKWTAPILTVGQQALPAFLFSMGASYVAGMALDQLGRPSSNLDLAIVNITGLLLVILLAHVAAWYKSTPWRRG